MSETQKPEPPDEFTYDLDPCRLAEPVHRRSTEETSSGRTSPAPPWSSRFPASGRRNPIPPTSRRRRAPRGRPRSSPRAAVRTCPLPPRHPSPGRRPRPRRNPNRNRPTRRMGTTRRCSIEETPTFDTIEARQRARLIVGGLGVFCVHARLLISAIASSSAVPARSTSRQRIRRSWSRPHPAVRPSARASKPATCSMKAEEFAKGGRTDQAVGMLKRIVASYKGTQSAVEARAALERPKRNLPLFPDGPALWPSESAVEALPAQAASPGMNSRRPPAATQPIAMGPSVAMVPVSTADTTVADPSIQPPPVQTQPAQPPTFVQMQQAQSPAVVQMHRPPPPSRRRNRLSRRQSCTTQPAQPPTVGTVQQPQPPTAAQVQQPQPPTGAIDATTGPGSGCDDRPGGAARSRRRCRGRRES